MVIVEAVTHNQDVTGIVDCLVGFFPVTIKWLVVTAAILSNAWRNNHARQWKWHGAPKSGQRARVPVGTAVRLQNTNVRPVLQRDGLLSVYSLLDCVPTLTQFAFAGVELSNRIANEQAIDADSM